MGVRNVVEEQAWRSSGQVFQRSNHGRHSRTVLANITGPRRHRAVHPYAQFVRAMPHTPTVALRSLHRNTVVVSL